LKDQSAVQNAEKVLREFKPVDYDLSKWNGVVDAFEGKAVAAAKETLAKISKEEGSLKETLSNIQEARPFEDLTVSHSPHFRIGKAQMRDSEHNESVQWPTAPASYISLFYSTRIHVQWDIGYFIDPPPCLIMTLSTQRFSELSKSPTTNLQVDEVGKARPEITKATETMLKKGKWTVPGYRVS